MTIGLKDLYYAKCVETDSVETYDTPKKMAEAMTADLSQAEPLNLASKTLYRRYCLIFWGRRQTKTRQYGQVKKTNLHLQLQDSGQRKPEANTAMYGCLSASLRYRPKNMRPKGKASNLIPRKQKQILQGRKRRQPLRHGLHRCQNLQNRYRQNRWAAGG